VLADNRRMLDLITRFGAIAERKVEHGIVELVFTAPAAAAYRGIIAPIAPAATRRAPSSSRGGRERGRPASARRRWAGRTVRAG